MGHSPLTPDPSSKKRRDPDKFGLFNLNSSVFPDFQKLRHKLSIINIHIAASILIIEIIISIIMHFSDLILVDAFTYILHYIAVPTIIDTLILLAQFFALKMLKSREFFQNLAVMAAMVLMCTVVASVHHLFGTTLAIFVIPVLTSSVFCIRLITRITSVISLFGLVAVGVLRYIRVGGFSDLFWPEAIISLVLIIISDIVAEQIVSVMEGQNLKLVAAVSQAQDSQNEAQLANQAKSAFLVNMSHEIRTPINAILGMNEMILREERESEIREYAMNIQSSGNALLSIINDVLDISKIESGKIEIIKSSYDISSLINDCYNMAAARARGKELQIIVSCDENIPRLLSGDETHIRQIIVNLLTNAIKYTNEGSVTITVGGEFSEGGYILDVSVKDTGIGIAKENMDNLFGRFIRFDMKRNRGIEGTGLGLSIVKHLVNLMDGKITVQSELNVGSEFRLTIPQEIVDSTPVGDIHLNYSHSQDYGYVRSFVAPDANILAVDDLPVNLMVITNMLKCTQVHVDTAESGKAAIELAKQKHYDIILMDHMMPEMDGVETYAQLRREKTMCDDTPVIMLTANAIAGVREKYMGEGFADYISKPVRGDKLESVIKSFLPPGLIKEYNEKGKDEDGIAQKQETLSGLTAILPSINLKLALPFCCNNIDLYLDILNRFAENTRLEEMEKQFETESFEDYRINVHSLKSTSLTVGLEGLSERARASEFALKTGNIEYAKLLHNELMKMYKESLEKIREFLSEKD